jgi:hypothetical protein
MSIRPQPYVLYAPSRNYCCAKPALDATNKNPTAAKAADIKGE